MNMKKNKISLKDQFKLQIPIILFSSFICPYLVLVVTKQISFSFDKQFFFLFVFPAYIANILINIRQGRFIFALPKFFNYPIRRRVRRSIVFFQYFLFIILSSMFILNTFFLFPLIIDSNSKQFKIGPHLKVIYSICGVTDIDSAYRFATSKYWGWFLIFSTISAIYIIYRKYIEFKARENLIKIYATNATVGGNLLKNEQLIEYQ